MDIDRFDRLRVDIVLCLAVKNREPQTHLPEYPNILSLQTILLLQKNKIYIRQKLLIAFVFCFFSCHVQTIVVDYDGRLHE